MRQTIIGFFRSTDEANEAAGRLRSSGFADSDIDVSLHMGDSLTRGDYTSQGSTPYSVTDEARYDTGSTTQPSSTLNEDKLRERRGETEGGGFGESIGRFFRHLFDNEEDAERYARAGRRNAIVSVYAESPVEAERARDILDECGAVDIDDETFSMGSYTDTVSSETETDINQSREDLRGTPALSQDRLTPENISAPSPESEATRRQRSRIFERPVDENLRLRSSSSGTSQLPGDRAKTSPAVPPSSSGTSLESGIDSNNTIGEGEDAERERNV